MCSRFDGPTTQEYDAELEELGFELPSFWLSIGSHGVSPSWLLIPAILLMLIVPVWSCGHILGLRLPRWLPRMPSVAEQEAETLSGIADAIEAGWPVRRALEVESSISTNDSQRRAMYNAMVMIDQGIEPAAALHRVGWIDAGDASWLAGASSQRTADLLRIMADQGARDATANLRWLMAILFPIVVLILGVTVMAYASELFFMLTRLVL